MISEGGLIGGIIILSYSLLCVYWINRIMTKDD